MGLFDKMLCKHEWKLEDKNVFGSPWAQMDNTFRQSKAPAEKWVFNQRVLITYICKKCGKIREQRMEE